ncbi:uroporphyrin-III C-methyltransferase [Thoreauomyces humboldtii]|nr:uroporphyrin-III C-methyltransferase [Thoreauomyces humboldtii]
MTTHVSHCKAGNALDIQGNGVIKRFEPDSRSFRNAPLPAVTVWDAISDLPPFEFEAPVRSQSLKKYQLDALQSSEIYLKKRKLRRKHPIPSFPVADAQPVGLPSLPYTLPPLNEYQRSLRGSATTCTNHQTTAFGDLTVARIICVPYSRGADHRHLPSALAINRDINGPFTRMDPTHQFPVVTTAIHCAGKFGAVLHPIQDRIATARERARAQGFPDRFVFRAEPNKRGAEKVTDIYRQIGNAVPPPLARALGRRLLVAVRKDRGVGQLNRNDTALEETTVVAAPAPEARPSLTCPTAVSLTPDVLPAAPVLFPPSAQTSSGSIAIPRKLVPRPRKTEVYIDLTTPSPVRKSSSTPTSIRPHRFSIPSASASPATVSNLVAPSPHPPPPSKKRRSTVEIVIDVSPKRRR